MSDDSGSPPEAPLIDVRSPAERWGDSARSGFERWRGRVDEHRLDLLSLAWMLLVLVIVALEIYSAIRFSEGDFAGGPDWWLRLALLSQTGSGQIIFGSMIGIALAVLSGSARARITLGLVIVAGMWTVVAAALGVAVAFHEQSGAAIAIRGGEGKVVNALAGCAYAGLGLVVIVVARRVRADRVGAGTPAVRPAPGEAELTELS